MPLDIAAKAGYALFPPTCVLCGDSGAGKLDLCGACRLDLPHIETACRRCGLPVPATDDARCGRCIANPPRFDRLFSPLQYQPPADWLIHRLKFNARFAHARVLGRLLGDCIEKRHDRLPQLLIPVPLHTNRLNERGFNQALEIARPLARRFEVPLAAGVCARRQDTPHQLSLPAGERRANVRKAFELTRPLACKHVALIDDVVTTGSTVNELARLLKRGGAVRVDVWAVARAVFG